MVKLVELMDEEGRSAVPEEGSAGSLDGCSSAHRINCLETSEIS